MNRFGVILFGILLLLNVDLTAQRHRVYYSVDSAAVSYHIKQGTSIPVKKGEKIELQDSIAVRSENYFYGCLRVISPQGGRFDIYSPKGPCTLKNALSGDVLSNIQSAADGFFKGLFEPVEVLYAALRHLWGMENDIAEGLSVSFLCGDRTYQSFKQIPAETPFSIVLSNSSDSVMVYSLVFQYRNKEAAPYESLIVDAEPDGTPLVLVPGESVAVPMDFVRPQGYIDYYLNIFGGTGFFVLQVNAAEAEEVGVYSVSNEVEVKKMYFESDE